MPIGITPYPDSWGRHLVCAEHRADIGFEQRAGEAQIKPIPFLPGQNKRHLPTEPKSSPEFIDITYILSDS